MSTQCLGEEVTEKPTEETKPTEVTKPTDSTQTDGTKPTDWTKPTDMTKPTDWTKPTLPPLEAVLCGRCMSADGCGGDDSYMYCHKEVNFLLS